MVFQYDGCRSNDAKCLVAAFEADEQVILLVFSRFCCYEFLRNRTWIYNIVSFVLQVPVSGLFRTQLTSSVRDVIQ